MIEAGTERQIQWGTGNWIFLDLGFSGAAGVRGQTCGLVISNSDPMLFDFGKATARIADHVVASETPVSLVIEAPLSVCFSSSGRPAGRSIERKDRMHRYWYTGAGCCVMVAAMYLIRTIEEAAPSKTVRLFEAFVSYKTEGAKSDHKREADALRHVVLEPKRHAANIIPAAALKSRADDDLRSAFRVMGLDCGIPAVILL